MRLLAMLLHIILILNDLHPPGGDRPSTSPNFYRVFGRLQPILALGQLLGAEQECLGRGVGRGRQSLCCPQQPVQEPKTEEDFLGSVAYEAECVKVCQWSLQQTIVKYM